MQLSVLLVEDSLDDEWLALRALRKLGLEQVTVARDGSAALALLCTPGESSWPGSGPDLVLLDLKLPKLDGIEVLRRLRSDPATSGLRVVVLTSSEDPHALAVCRDLGALDCLQKPLTGATLLPLLLSVSGRAEAATAA